jgi:5-methylcytosine-specific restriction endonuclease McrA
MFEQLYDSLKRGELILIDGGLCRYHLRRDGQLTIHEIVSTRPGAGQEMLARLRAVGAARIVAKCPADLPSNAWYARRGFQKIAEETTPSGRHLNVWTL